MAISRVIIFLVMAAWCAVPIAAQVSIQVTDSDGNPIPAARVDVFGLGELIGTASTSALGLADLDFERWSAVRRVSISHVGFRTLIVQVEDIPDDGALQLMTEATEIEGLTVEAPELCPIDDELRARRLWAEIAARYAQDTGSRAYLGYFSSYSGTVVGDPLAPPIDSLAGEWVTAGDPYVWHGDDRTLRPLEERITADGYAWPPLVIGGAVTGRARSWAYPALDREHAYHFASPIFGALHDFAAGTESEGGTTLVFCDNGTGGGATVEGVIRLDYDRGFVSAEWRFDTDDPVEGAGGSVRFASYREPASSKPHLVSSGGVYFRDRHVGNNVPYPELQPAAYSRQVTTAMRWRLLPSMVHACNEGRSYFPLPPGNPQSARFAQCVSEHWGVR